MLEDARLAGVIDSVHIQEYKPAAAATLLFSLCSLGQVGCFVLLYMGAERMLGAGGESLRALGAWMDQRSGMVVAGAFLVPMALQSLLSSGSAFEVFVGGRLVFSGIARNGRFNFQDIVYALESAGLEIRLRG